MVSVGRQSRIALLVLLFATFSIFLSPTHALQRSTATATTFTPQSIPLTAPEIGNPGRGLHRWNGQTYVDAPMFDSYRRVHWSEVEGDQGAYTFNKYDNEVTSATAQHMRVILGLPQPSGPSSNGGSWMPPYLTSDELGVTARDTYYPNFNRPFVLSRWKALIDAIADRYADDERVSGIQLCIVGAYGEWYFDPSVPAAGIPQEATWKAMIDYVITKFPSKQLYMMISSTIPEATIYAFQQSPRIGWARMAIGHRVFDQTFEKHYQDHPDWWELVSKRWKTAPIITETFPDGTSDQFTTMLRHVQQYHVSMIGNGNFTGSLYNAGPPPPETWTSEEISNFQEAGKRAGYRYQLDSLSLGPLAPGVPFAITTRWENVGNAPVYEPWRVQLQLQAETGEVVFTSTLKGDLRAILPTSDKPVTWRDAFMLPSSITPGSYHVRVFIPPLNQFVPPLQLAIGGQQSDGSYDLGDVVVGTSAPPNASPVMNGGFEVDSDGDGHPDKWTSNAHATRTNTTANRGSYALQHRSDSNSDYSVSQTVSGISSKKTYILSAAVNIPPISDDFSFTIQVQWLDSNYNVIRTDTVKQFTEPTDGWEQVLAAFVTQGDTANAKVQMRVQRLNGTLYADSFVLTPGNDDSE